MMLKRLFQIFSLDKAAFVLIIIGSCVWSLTMVKSGLVYPYGMGFWGANGHDGIWHIALAQGLSGGTWNIPIFSGEVIKNYHIGFDLVLAILHKLTFIPIFTLYFQILPPIFAFLIGLFVYLFIYKWKHSKNAAFWTTLFVYFGGSWGWLVTLLRSGEIGGESIFWSQQSISTLVNPPFALSLIILFAGLNFLMLGSKSSKSRANKYYLLATLLFGILVQVKVYAGILVLSSLFVTGFRMMLKRCGISLLKVFTGSIIISILIFSPLSKDVGQEIVFQPFWFLESMVSSLDRFYWPKMASAIANYKLAGNWIKLLPAYGLLLLIFWFGNLGTRVIGGWSLVVGGWKIVKKADYIAIFVFMLIALGIILPLLFIQKGTPWNTIQFMYYSLVFSGILAGTWFGEWLDNLKSSRSHKAIPYGNRVFSLGAIVVLLTIPTTIGTLRHYLPTRPPAMISNLELEALDFLKKQPNGVVLTLPFNREAAEKAVGNPPRPLYLYESSAYVSAFSEKPTYLEDEVNLEITSYDWRERKSELESIFGESCDIRKDFFKKNNISYAYLIKQNLCNREFEDFGEKIFENLEVVIYRIKNTGV